MARLFENSIKSTRENLKECEALILKYNKKLLTDEDVNHYAKVYGFEAKARRSVVTNIHEKKNDY